MDVELTIDSYTTLREDGGWSDEVIAPIARKSFTLRFTKMPAVTTSSSKGTSAAKAWETDRDEDGTCDRNPCPSIKNKGNLSSRIDRPNAANYRGGGMPGVDDQLRVNVRITETNRFGSTIFELLERAL